MLIKVGAIMKLYESLLQQVDSKLHEHKVQNSLEHESDSRIQQLEQQLTRLQQEALNKEEVYKQLNSKLAIYEKIEELVKVAQLEELKMRNIDLAEKIRELEKRPTLEDYNSKNKLIQQLAMQLKKALDDETDLKENNHLLEHELADLKETLQSTTNNIERLETVIDNFGEQNNILQQQVAQLESKLETMVADKNSLEGNYTTLQQDHEELQNNYQQQQSQIEELQEQIKQTTILEVKKPSIDLQSIPEGVEILTEAQHEEIISPLLRLTFDEEETEHIAFDQLELDEISDEKELFLEKEIDETKMVQAISEVLLNTVPKSDEDGPNSFPDINPSSFLPRDNNWEHKFLTQVINRLSELLRDIPKVDFNSTYEIDPATAYAEGIMRKRSHDHNRHLEYVKDKPYIARVDYVTQEGADTMYIGEHGIEGFVTSWKAEAASLYYLRTVGQLISHKTLGEVTVDYLRQIDIQFGTIKTLHPPITATSQYFKDEGLVSALKNKRGTDMKSIVATLQREQYEIIRLPMKQPIIIQGSAGSGKSAIALHRLSYLLYKYQNLTANKVAIIGPNKAFLHHIQSVLPTLGDYGIKQTTFLEIVCDILLISSKKVKRHQVRELEIIKFKGSLDFRSIVEQTTINMMNDLRIWAKTYTSDSVSIPIVPILREMEKYPHLTLKDRVNLYYNFYLKSLQSELQKKNEVQKQLKQWIKEEADAIAKQELKQLSLYQDEFITTEIANLGSQWVGDLDEYQLSRSNECKKKADVSRRQFVTAIEKAMNLIMVEHNTVLQQLVSNSTVDTIIAIAWRHFVQCELRHAKEAIILKYVSEQPVEVLRIDGVIDTSIIQHELKEEQERVLQKLEKDQHQFYHDQKDMVRQAVLAETLVLLEQAYIKKIKEALKSRYGLEFSFNSQYHGFKFEEEQKLSTKESDSHKKFVIKHLELNNLDCFDEAIRVAKTEGLFPNDFQSSHIFYEDLPALLHIFRLTEGVSKDHMLSYLIVDEAQDYMPYEIVEMHSLTRKNGLMLIGDLGQNLNPASSLQDWHTLDQIIGDPTYFELKGTYRSTAQIVEVSNEIIKPYATGRYNLSTETFRDGEEVKWITCTAITEEEKLIAILDEAILTNNLESIAVIVKDEALLEHYRYMIDPYFSVAIQTEAELPKNVKVVITTPTAVKGLEFSAVVIARFNDYKIEDFDRKLAYVATSRALHQLYIMIEQGKESLIGASL